MAIVTIVLYSIFGSIIISSIVRIVDSHRMIKSLNNKVEVYVDQLHPLHLQGREPIQHKQTYRYLNHRK